MSRKQQLKKIYFSDKRLRRRYILTNKNMRSQITSGISKLLLSNSLEQSSRKSSLSMADETTRSLNGKMLQDLETSVPTSPINGYASLVNFAPSADRPIHRWFWYREGYSLDLVTELISELPRGSVVLDPFCGSGTTLVAAKEKGLPAVGFDVNPISILVSRVKTTRLDELEVQAVRQHLIFMDSLSLNSPADPKPGLSIVDKVFDAGVLQSLLVLRKAINDIKNARVKEFLFVAWLSILEGVSNVYKEGNGIKYKNRKRTENGYITVDLAEWAAASLPEDRLAFVRERLSHKCKDMLADIPLMPTREVDVAVHEVSAESVHTVLEPNSVSIAIFSPPYCNCFNYFKMYKVELWMGGFVQNYDDMKRLNRTGLRSHVETVLKRDGDDLDATSNSFAKLLDGLELWDKRIPDAVRGYFVDMEQVLKSLHTVLKPSAKCVIVVGNSAYGGVVIPTDSLLAKIGQRCGFKVEKLAVARHLTTSSQQRAFLDDRMSSLRESILVLVKEDPRLTDKELVSVEEIPNGDSERHGNVFLIKNGGLTAGTHKFHRYPGKFIPHVPRWAIKRYLSEPVPTSVVVDPFCGSGTTLAEAAALGIRSIGIDVDPIARLVSRVKTRPIDGNRLKDVVADVSLKVRRRSVPNFLPTIPTLDHWFSKDAVRDLGVIRGIVEEYAGEVEIYEFLLVCFASVIRRASNADNQTQKTYVSHTKHKIPDPAKPLFLRVLDDYARRLLASNISSTTAAAVLDTCDAVNFGTLWMNSNFPSVDLIVTSPPYLNSVDYVYNQMAEYFWIGDLFGMANQASQNEHKRRYVGSTKVDSAVYKELPETGIPSIDSIAQSVRRKNTKNGYIVAKYFVDMLAHFKQSAMVLKSGGHYVSVVGDSLVSGESIPVHQLLIQCAEQSGFCLEGQFGYEIRNRHMRFPRMGRGGIVRYDWVLEFRRK